MAISRNQILVGGGIVGVLAILYFANKNKKEGIVTGGVKPPKDSEPANEDTKEDKPRLQDGSDVSSPSIKQPVKEPIKQPVKEPVKQPVREPISGGTIEEVFKPAPTEPTITKPQPETPRTGDKLELGWGYDDGFAKVDGEMNTLDVH